MICTDERVVEYLKGKGLKLPPNSRIIGIEYEGKIVGAFTYSRWRMDKDHIVDVELSVYCDRPESFTRGIQRISLAYPFEQLGVERVTVLVEDGSTSQRLARFNGFQYEGTMRRLHGPDLLVYGRLNDE